MTTVPKWEAGHLYLPGDLVQPLQVAIGGPVAITNAGFETGDATGWTLPAGASVVAGAAYAGSYRVEFTGTGGNLRMVHVASAVTPGKAITASAMYAQGAASSGDNPGRIVLVWYDAGSVEISESLGNIVSEASNGAWKPSSVTGTAPATAAFVAVGFRTTRNDSNASSADQFTWNLATQSAPQGLIYKAVQPDPGTSANAEPVWPTTLGVQVIDNTVTWEAVYASRVTWQASPILQSGTTEPTWPTEPGAFVSDGTISWECITRRVEDEKCPNSREVVIIASKVYAADGDIVRFSATANPLDWTSENDAGYLPTGLQSANANGVKVLAQYRGNLAPFNASSFQNWQVDPDPQNMAILDQMEGIGSTWNKAAQPVANDLFYLSQLGVRSVGIAAGTDNLAAGDIGMPIDVLVRAKLSSPPVLDGVKPLATYYPGAGQYWLAFRDCGIPTITGSLPDGTVGDVVSYQLTVTLAYPGQVVTVSATGLPTGLSCDAGGLITGTLTAAGDYTPTYTATADCGTGTATDAVTIADSAQIKWWLTFNGTTGPDNKVWFSANALTWSNQTTRSPNVDAELGLHWTGTRMVAMGATQAETTADFDFSGGIATTVTTPTYPGSGLTHHIENVGGVLITVGQTNYSVSTDHGLTWTDHASPGGNTLLAVSRLDSGRWLALTTGLGYFYYSDEALPTAWTLATNASTVHSPEYGIFSYGDGAFHVDNSKAIRRTTDGAAWDYTAGLFPFAFGSGSIQGATDGAGVWIIPHDSLRKVARTADNGATWTTIDMPGGAVADAPRVNTTKYGGGLFVVCYPGNVFVSADLGLTWTESTLPVTGEGGYPAVGYAG